MNYFEWFGLETRPFIDRTGLSKKYFELQKEYHPDHFSGASEQEKETALTASAMINDGYDILKSEDKTLEYFLEINGQLDDSEQYQLPADFLMEMMELNEELEEHPEKTSSAIEQFSDTLQHAIAVFRSSEGAESLTPEDFEILKAYYFKKKYLNRILDRIKD